MVMKIAFVLLFMGCYSLTFAQRMQQLSVSDDSTYGYSINNPMQIKLGNTGKSYDYFTNMISQLTTPDGQGLLLLKRFTVDDPNYKGRRAFPRRNYQQNIFKKSRYGVKGQLEQFQFLTEASKDTITLYVDFDERSKVRIPMGLKLK
jgi:hypothetical protein